MFVLIHGGCRGMLERGKCELNDRKIMVCGWSML